MTSTGRVAFITGTITGATWLYNSHLDRQQNSIVNILALKLQKIALLIYSKKIIGNGIKVQDLLVLKTHQNGRTIRININNKKGEIIIILKI